MTSINGLSKLEEAAKEYEKDMAVELSADKILKWLGVYLLLGLAVFAKVGETLENKIICLPANESVELNRQLITYASLYCWETSQHHALNNCSLSASVPLSQMPESLKDFVQWLPYIILEQAFVFVAPWAYWHFRFGASVLGHLKFVQLFSDIIFKKISSIHEQKGFYAAKSFYKYEGRVGGDDRYQPKLKNGDQLSCFDSLRTCCLQSNEGQSPKQCEESIPMRDITDGDDKAPTSDQPREDRYELKLSMFEKLLVGKMRDQHFLSLLCYENHGLISQLLYLRSVQKLTSSAATSGRQRPAGYYNINHGILLLWSDKNNLQNVFLIKTYLAKHLFTALIAFVMLILQVLAEVLIVGNDASTSFACQLDYGNICAMCTIQRRRDVSAILLCDFLLISIMLIASIMNWWKIRKSANKTACYYFNQLNEIGEVESILAKQSEDFSEQNLPA